MNDVECSNVSLALLSEGTCAASGIHLVFIVVPIALLLIVAGVVIMCKVVSVQKRKKAKSRFVRYTSVRGSTRSASLGGSYNVRTQDHIHQLPASQPKFEYVDMLAQTPTTQRAWSEDNLTASLEQRNLDSQESNLSSEQLIEGSRLYDEPEVGQDRTRTPSQYNRTVSMPSQQRSSTAMQRGASARASTRSMPGSIVNSRVEAVQRKRVRTQTSEFQRPVQNRERVRSMYDPLPDVPTENNRQQPPEPSPIAAEPEIVINVLTPNTPEHAILRNDQLTPPPPPESRVSCSPSEKQFSFEDGSVLHSDVPPFLDPDVTLENRSDEVQGISIYSSQILATSEGEDAGDPEEDMTSSTAESDTETRDSELYNRLDRSLNPHSQKAVHFVIQEQERSQPEQERSQPEGAALYSQINLESSDSSQGSEGTGEQAEVLYDLPVVVVNKPADDNQRDLKNLFDDPGYTKGMMAARLASDEPSPQAPQDTSDETGFEIDDNDEFQAMAVSSVKPTDTLATQVNPTLKLSVDSLALLDYQEDELGDLDPDIASCLMSTEDLDQQISYV